MDLDHSLVRHLKPLGHEIALWRTALMTLRGRALKGRLPEGLTKFVTDRLPPEGPGILPDTFSIGLHAGGGRVRVAAASLPFVMDATWLALFWLPALRAEWAGLLRGSHLEHLRLLLPEAWFITREPLPPGAVIPRLNLTAWADGPSLQRQNLHLRLSQGDAPDSRIDLGPESSEVKWRESFAAALANERSCLIDLGQGQPPMWKADYRQDANGIHFTGATPAVD